MGIVREFLADAVPNGVKPVASPMPNKRELTSDSTLLDPQEAKWFRSTLMGAALIIAGFSNDLTCLFLPSTREFAWECLTGRRVT